ncbi:hypothetical protein SLE2022_017970 [Rubroshorea leprosula]
MKLLFSNKVRTTRMASTMKNSVLCNGSIMDDLPAAPSVSKCFSVVLKFYALLNVHTPMTTIRALKRSGCPVSFDVSFTYLDLPIESAIMVNEQRLTHHRDS